MTQWLSIVSSVLPAEIPGAFEPTHDLSDASSQFSVHVVLGSIVALLILLVLAPIAKRRFDNLKLPVFILMATVILLSSLSLSATAFYLNSRSLGNGPERRLAGIEFWACGNELELKDPDGIWSNKIGSATFYERDDKLVHFEGLIVDPETDASLGKFMYEIGGAITPSTLVVPLNSDGNYFENDIDGDGRSDFYPFKLNSFIVYDGEDTYAKFTNGEQCGVDEAYLQVFVYHFDENTNTYYQEKLSNPGAYTIADYPTVPPGDCVIVEFDKNKAQTDKLCRDYGTHDAMRCQEFGVVPGSDGYCSARQLNYPALDPNLDKLKTTGS